MPLTDLRKNKTGLVAKQDDRQSMPDVYDVTHEVDEVTYEVETVPYAPLIEPIPDGRWGIEKVVAWFEENGIAFDESDDKDNLITIAKTLHAEQETE
ncbi:MAG: hypothetical protein DRQ39_06840 [Gammaproteobacteria bacterium]|nr:MAG: hypothetical protein DRQ39_06840 [Gammaproteobacteria bacterium]